MEWAKAKNILIVILVILNIFLLFATLYGDSSVRFKSGYTKYAEAYLESHNIKIETNIKDKTGKSGMMIYTTKNFDFDKLKKFVFGHGVDQAVSDNSIVLIEGKEKIELVGDELNIRMELSDAAELTRNPDKFLKRAYEIFEEVGFHKKNFVLQSSQNDNSLYFISEYKNALLFDQSIKMNIDNEGFLNASFPARDVKRVNNADTEVLSIYQILVMSNLPEGSVIKSVNFGYKQIDEEKLYDCPVWRIILSDEATVFYDAYTGEELRNGYNYKP